MTARADEAVVAELAAVSQRTRLLLYRDLAWRAHLAATPGTPTDPEAVAAWRATDARAGELDAARAQLEAELPRLTPRLRRLAELFGLDAREVELVQITLAAASDPELAGGFAAANGRGLASEALIARLCDHGPRRVLTADSPLARWHLIRRVELAPGEPDGLILDPAIVDWFTGAYAIEALLVAAARRVTPVAPLDGWPLATIVDEIAGRWRSDGAPQPVRVIVSAPAGTGRTSFASAVCARLGMNLLALAADDLDETTWPDAVRAAHRQAFLTQAAVAFVGDCVGRRAWPALPMPFPLSFVCAEPGAVIAPLHGAADLFVELPPPTSVEREALWQQLVPAAVAWSSNDRGELARRYRATPADIVAVANRNAVTPGGAAAIIRDRDRGRLGDLALRLECPFDWSDLVLPSATIDGLRDFAYEGGIRHDLWAEAGLRRMFPHGRGLFLLLTGAPGTGKTMAAQVIARALGQDLFRISLSTVVSKYIGETAKNLTRILARAEHMDAVLLFDEADALFGKRTDIKDAHDRYANTDTNHLLQAIEAYAGVAILTSNKRGNIDSAFIRRLRYVLELPRPDVAQRRTLWRRLTRDLTGVEVPTIAPPAFDALATLDLTGAQIKYAVLAAVVAARRDGVAVTSRHLMLGVDRELQKDGRSLSEREREGVAHAI